MRDPFARNTTTLAFDPASRIDRIVVGRIGRAAATVFLAVAVASCGVYGGQARPVQEDPPSVTYEYTDDEGLVDAMMRAEEYCHQFSAWPSMQREDLAQRDVRSVTFVCNQERTTASERTAAPSDPTVRYSYRDEPGLVEATTEAQRHCADVGARAHLSTITADGGTRTVVFECVR